MIWVGATHIQTHTSHILNTERDNLPSILKLVHHPCLIIKISRISHIATLQGECLGEGEICKQPCPQSRSQCGHPCGVSCHGSEPCPRVACKAEVILRCQCGNREEKTRCMMGGETDDNADYIRFVKNVTVFSASTLKPLC